MTVINAKGKDLNQKTSDEEESASHILDSRKTPWRSIWTCIGMQFINGIQISIYYMSMWPYLNGLDPSASLDFLGWVVAACSLGCSVANPIFGYWNQRTMSVTVPTVTGFSISALGQLLYAFLPLFTNSTNTKWIMMGARFITGFGAGSLSVLRTYVATAAVPKDQLSAISYGTAGWVLGVSFGPAIQAMFTPVGNGWMWGKVVFDMYTIPAFFMFAITVGSCVAMSLLMKEEYNGIIDHEERDKGVVVPKFDFIAASVCIWFWIVANMISTNIEVISTPLSTAMYGWNDSTSILYNGLFETASCVISVATNFAIGYTRIGRIDKRKQILVGMLAFLLFHVFCYPWPFYSGPLEYIPSGNTSAQVGGCDPSYTWCETSVRVPLPLYIFCFVVLYGVSFPFVGSPSASLYSDILGPRPQGMMQGLYSFGGSVAQFAAPILATFLFEHTGYKYVMLTQILGIGSALLLMFIFYRRLVALRLLYVPRSMSISTILTTSPHCGA